MNRIGVELIITLNGSQSKLIRRIVIAYIAKQKVQSLETESKELTDAFLLCTFFQKKRKQRMRRKQKKERKWRTENTFIEHSNEKKRENTIFFLRVSSCAIDHSTI